MKELKFRAWRKTLKKYVDVIEIDFMNELVVFVYDDYSVPEQVKIAVKSEDVIIEQYTGLKDKDGVEIYEGDIVKDIHSTYEVQDMGQLLDYGYYEVIGNIHENGDLLK